MSKRARSPPTLGLRLNFSPPREATDSSSPLSGSADDDMSSPKFMAASSSSSVSVNSSEGSSCVSSSEAEVTKAMLLVGCPRCFMYVMSSEIDPKCPRCKSTVLLDLLIKKTST